jgi:hypothetical protein
MDQLAMNLFDGVPARAGAEVFTEVLSRDGLRIERIVSTGQFTPADKPHRQGMTNGFYSSPVRRACALRARVNAIFGLVTMF